MLLTLSNDNLNDIAYHLDIKHILTLFKICKQLYDECRPNNLITILSLKLDMKNSNLNQLLLRYHRNCIMPILNLLCRMYDIGTDCMNSSIIMYNNKGGHQLDKYLDLASKYNAQIYHKFVDLCPITQLSLMMLVPIPNNSNIKTMGTIKIQFDSSILSTLSQTIIAFKTIIIHFRKAGYSPYNHYVADVSSLIKYYPYIKVNDQFDKLILSSDIKGSPFVADDILLVHKVVSRRNFNRFCEYLVLEVSDYDTLYIKFNS